MHRRNFLKTSAAASLTPLFASTALSQTQPAQVKSFPPEKIKALRDRITPITADERKRRIERARELMAKEKMDALFFEGGTSLTYFTGIGWGRSERLFAMILPKNGEPQYVAPKFEEARAAEQVGSARLLTWEEDESPCAPIKQILKENNILTGTLGIEETTRFFVTDRIAREIGTLKLVSGTPVTAGCRSVKSPHEIELMQIANDITAEVYKAAVGKLHEGMSERELGSTVSKLFSEFGVGGGALVLFGEASAYPHGLARDYALHEGDIVLIDGGCSVEGYESDVTRTTVLGKATDKMHKVWEIVRNAQSAAVATARPGIPAEEVDAAARKVIAEAGYGPGYRYFTHRLGHGIGLEGHEWYYLVRGSQRPLVAGNTFSDEPGIYITGEFGIRLEDELLVTENGARLLLPQAESLEKIFP
jgi:Xaa-Pro dipeptidase